MTANPQKFFFSELRLTPQAKTILRHLKKHKAITPSQALITYAISRLASCIHEIRRCGHDVKCVVEHDERGHRFGRYTLVVPESVY